MIHRLTIAASLLLVLLLPSLAWDADRMTQAAQRIGPRAVASVRLLQPLIAQAADGDVRGQDGVGEGELVRVSLLAERFNLVQLLLPQFIDFLL